MLITDEHKQIQATLDGFIEREINPNVDQWEAEGMFPAHEVFKKMGDLDLLGVTKENAYGGLDLDYSYSVALAETLGNINCGSIGMAIGVQTDMATPALAQFGSPELKETFLKPAIAGDYVACVGVSEPHAGSDVGAIKTHAKSDGDDYLINGSKMWITNSIQADWICLLANTSDGAVHRNKSLIVVPMKTKGITLSPKLDKLGMRSSDTAQIFFDNVRVPKSNRIGEEGMGFTYQMMQFQEERMFSAATSAKMCENILNQTIEYTRTREAFGRPLIDNQVIHFRLAELQTEIEALRSLVYQACEIYCNYEDATRLASMAKLKGGRLAREVTDACLQYWGGMGYMWDNPVSRAYRDSRLMSIGGGADEVMLGIICKYMRTLPKIPT